MGKYNKNKHHFNNILNEYNSMIYIIIPAYNEENSIAKVLQEIPKNLAKEIIVVNNASTDNTAQIAENHGAVVLSQPKKGYGNACLKGLEYLKTKNHVGIVVFMDGDYSDYPAQMTDLVKPILENTADLVIGSRALGKRQTGSMTAAQIFGNWLATNLLKIIYGIKFTDLGPFRAINYESLLILEMQDTTYGWTVEMQLKAAKHKLRCKEVAVDYRKRIGVSKISGTVKGVIMAGYKILYTIFKYAF
jgi:glycosyltransferase involved in cell wall biosynthesis